MKDKFRRDSESVTILLFLHILKKIILSGPCKINISFRIYFLIQYTEGTSASAGRNFCPTHRVEECTHERAKSWTYVNEFALESIPGLSRDRKVTRSFPVARNEVRTNLKLAWHDQ